MQMSNALTLASLLSSNLRCAHKGIGEFLSVQLGQPVVLLNGVPWEEQNRMLDQGRVDIAFLCGSVYVRKHDLALLELLAAPVMSPARYGGQPVYFTDVVVRADSGPRCFADLCGKTWAFNDCGSFSGYTVPTHHLLRQGESWTYFARAIASWSHAKSLELVLKGEADAAGLDSLMLDVEIRRRPGLAAQVRIIESIGPFPIPPVVVSSRVEGNLRDRLREILLGMYRSAEGRGALGDGLFDRFVPVADADYDPVREVLREVEAQKG
jgi:phosphonate transport system substrate-binding protein